jgi:3-phenylpropionate/trans-cinnamate dioxygenase ferredoxin reductase component
LKLMIAGLAHGVDQWVVRGDPATRAFSTFGFRDGKLAVVESVNRAGDHAAAQRITGTIKTLTPEEAADPAFDLRGVGETLRDARAASAHCCAFAWSYSATALKS